MYEDARQGFQSVEGAAEAIFESLWRSESQLGVTLESPRGKPPKSLFSHFWVTFFLFEPQSWPEMIKSRDAQSACFKGSRT